MKKEVKQELVEVKQELPAEMTEEEWTQPLKDEWTTEEDDLRDWLATDDELKQMVEIKQEMDADMSWHGTFFWGCYRSITVTYRVCTCN